MIQTTVPPPDHDYKLCMLKPCQCPCSECKEAATYETMPYLEEE